MKKTILFLLLAVFSVFSAKANPVDVNVAKNVGAKFLSATAKVQLRGNDLQLAKTYNINRGDAAFYVFNAPNGFVIVSGDDCAYPILGYSDNGRLFDINNIPIQLQDILQEYQDQIQHAIENNLVADEKTAEQWTMVKATGKLNNNRDNTQVGPLLTTTWDQGQYYNAMCPADPDGPDGHCVTGCVATAMAQIINYHGYPASGRGAHSYDSNYGTLTVNYAESNYDYANMPDALTNQSLDTQVNAVAKLISDCGMAVNMGYSSGESSAYDQEARAALINFFRYSPNLSFAEKFFFDADEWADMLRADLDANRPVYYSGKGTGGHAFVCDGYNSDGYFSFNFGWSGAGNDWYLLDAVNPLGMNFNSNQAAILGIVPDANGNVIIGQMSGTSTFTVDEPLEFYHTMGHNQYVGYNYTNPCDNTVTFVSSDLNDQIVADIIEIENQQLILKDVNDNVLRTLTGGDANNDLSPLVSEANELKIIYNGNLFYDGFKVIISQNSACRMVSNVVSLVENTTVHLLWTENGSATQWEVEYGLEGFALGSGTTMTTNETTADITELTKFTTYDFYIRPVCGGSWYGPITLMALAPYWIDVVTTQPEGYSIDSEGNVTISSVEGLAWWAKLADNEHRYWRWLVYQEPFVPTIEGLDENMMQNGWCWNHPTTITTDIDLAGYRWKPVNYSADIDGQMHTISNMLIYEDASLEPEPYYGFLSGFSGPSQIGFTIKDILFQDPVINCPTGYYGVLVGMVLSANIRNIGVNNAVINQYSSSPFVSIYNVYGVAGGGLIGHAESTNIDNCYVTGNIVSEYPYYGVNNGGIVGYAENLSTINNSYSSVQIQSRAGGLGGICAFANGLEMRNCYGIDDYPILGHNDLSNGGISDTLQFDKNTQQLNGTVYFDDESCSTLLEALNMRVVYENNETWMTWTTDVNVVNDGLPVFSEPYIVTCPNTQNIVAVNVIINNQNALSLTWDDNDGVTQWRVKCVEKDAPDNTAQYYLKNDNSITITDLTLDKVYKIFVMPICDDTNQGGWGAGIEHVYDKPYWTDFVTTQPDGYVIDNDGNVTITSREGFVWFSCLVNGLHGQEYQSFQGKHIHLMTDVDLSQYRWMPIGNTWWNQFEGSFDGGNHMISNVYVNEYHDWVGLFGHVFQSQVLNVTLANSVVKGYSNVGAICGFYQNNDGWWDVWNYGPVMFDNCQIVNTSVYGDQLVGALVGRVENWIETTITNCSASGEVHGSYYVGGLMGNIKDYATIGNCYSTCDIYATDTDAGGLIGFSKNCVVENSYATGTITSTGGSYGKLIGYLCENITCHYLYGLEDENPINLFGYIGENCTIDNSVWFTSARILDNAVTISGTSYTDLLSALNAWVDANNTNGEYLHWVADTGNENGGFPMLERQPATTAQISSLTNGWNWWSTYIEQEGFDGLTMLEEALGANGENIKSQSVFVKRRANGTWMGQLTSLTNEDGYKISVTSDCTVAMLGAAADPGEHPITIKPNWTWIGYPLDVQQTVSVALSGYEPVVGDIIKGAGGFAKYRATGWMPSNFMLEPGKSYMYSSGATENKTLVYSDSRSNMKAETDDPHWQTDRHAYADNLTMIAVVKIDGEEQRDCTTEVGAFVNGECRGSARLMYDQETDRYLAMLTISGEDGDVIDFGVTNGGSQMLGSETRIRFTENAMIGDFTSPKEIMFGEMTDQSITIYPNPVGKDMPISLTLPTDDDVTEIVITDMLGVVVRHETANGKEITGISKPGVYMIRTVCKSGKVYNTRIIVK